MKDTEGCEADRDKSSSWIVFEIFQALVTIIGLVFNVISVISLQLHNKGFPAVSKVLYQHQACLDALVCLLFFLLTISPSCMGITGNQTVDLLLCQVWYSQVFFWIWVQISTWNIVYISFERFCMIHYPMRYRNTQVKHVCRGFCVIYALTFLLLLPAYFQVRYDAAAGKCISEYYFNNQSFIDFMNFFGGFWFFLAYAFPIVIFISMYVLTIFKIQHRQQKQIHVSQKGIYQKANKRITGTAVAIAICFVVSQSPDALMYLLNHYGYNVDYSLNSSLQTATMFFTTLNSVINPVIYCASLACFRKSLRLTFRLGFLKNYIDPPTASANVSIVLRSQRESKNNSPRNSTVLLSELQKKF